MDNRERHFLSTFLCIDLEVNKDDRIFKLAAVQFESRSDVIHDNGNLAKSLRAVDNLANKVHFLLGHNFINFDYKYLRATNPSLRLLRKPILDTLWLGPLAFPRNPYHHLVKHYQDPKLLGRQRNDPKLDAKLTIDVLIDQIAEFKKANQNLLLLWHYLSTTEYQNAKAFGALFSLVRGQPNPSHTAFSNAVRSEFVDKVCPNQLNDLIRVDARPGWSLAYALSWITVAGGNSVMPPWVRKQFPNSGKIVKQLRDTNCDVVDCAWCSKRHDAKEELKRWFGFDSYRSEPSTASGQSMQEAIVEQSMKGDHVLGILPTGTGKSICYQIPALNRFDNLGTLTVVISPLVALMADQVNGLQAQNINSCVAINGLLSMPERSQALDRVRLGDVSILLISPEQLRNRTITRTINQREVGGWVIDETHCLSSWGHDFRTDYRFVSRFIKEHTGDQSVPPILCLTATAKPEVIEEIEEHFHETLGIKIEIFNGGAQRPNLAYEVVPVEKGQKYRHILSTIENKLPTDGTSGAIVYCSTKHETEEIADYLNKLNYKASYFHSALNPETKKEVQAQFTDGTLRVIVATNAFGMGIDKPDVRLVLHADIPSSLESYFQEAGRAGRDRELAECVLLYNDDGVEWQFRLAARSRLNQREIRGLLKALRKLDAKGKYSGEVVATSGEILVAETEGDFERDSATDDTRVKTSIAWLEESNLLARAENRATVYPSSLMVNSVDHARRKLQGSSLTRSDQNQLLGVVEALLSADPDEGISTDELMGLVGTSPERMRKTMYDLESLKLVKNDLAITVFVHSGIANSSQKRYDEATQLESTLIAQMRELAPDMDVVGSQAPLQLRVASQALRDAGIENPIPEQIWRTIRSIANDGDSETEVTSLSVKRQGTESVQIKLQRTWKALDKTAELRRQASKKILDHLLNKLPKGSRGKDLLAETTASELYDVIRNDVFMAAQFDNARKLTDRALMWLHEQEIVRLNRGMVVFRPAMTIRIKEEKREFTDADFEPLKFFYQGQTLQIHLMAEYANLSLTDPRRAQRFAGDYFELKQNEFLSRWLPDKRKELELETTPDSWKRIVLDLRNPTQRDIVTDKRVSTNVLVLAGPGSGKTRVLVHRIAFLVRIQRENPRSILALAYNRHAAVEIRKRLHDLIGKDANGVMVLTCHALAMRLAGYTFAKKAERPDEKDFNQVLQAAIDLLQGKGLLPEDADEQRERLLAGFRWILVDEYQDIGREQYDLISALAGRTQSDADGKLTLFAVGDDDQNIYEFRGASIKFIKKFEQDYNARKVYLVQNYRSTKNIINASNATIEPVNQRMKLQYPIRINRERARTAPGGEWEDLDAVGQGKVQLLPIGDEYTQAHYAIDELKRQASQAPDSWDWSSCAVIARQWKFLDPVKSVCEAEGVEAELATDELPSLWQLRETRALLDAIHASKKQTLTASWLKDWLNNQSPNRWIQLLVEVIEEYELETDNAENPIHFFSEWLAEALRDYRSSQKGLLLLTAHGAKGLEFDHVVLLDGGWDSSEDERRLFYVAMTRARKNLVIGRTRHGNVFHPVLVNQSCVTESKFIDLPANPRDSTSKYQRLSLSDVFLSFAGERPSTDPIHEAITNLRAGDPLAIRQGELDRGFLRDANGRIVGRLANKYRFPDGMKLRQAHVFAVIVRKKEQSNPEYSKSLHNEKWEVVIPEFVFDIG